MEKEGARPDREWLGHAEAVRQDTVERMRPEEKGPSLGLRPSWGMWPAGREESAVLSTWAEQQEPGVFQPGKLQSGLGRIQG